MNHSKAHLKLTIRDIYNCNVSDDGGTFFTTLFSDQSKVPTSFNNVRVCGIVTQKKNYSFLIDDGTGMIVVEVPRDSFIEVPKISDYVEVFGELQLEGKLERKIIALCCSLKNEPMEEICHLLEQAAIHRNYLKYRQLTQQTFLSSEASTSTIYDAYTMKVSALFSQSDHRKGLTLDDIQKECDDSVSIAKRVIESLINSDEIYEDNDVYFRI